VVDIDKRLKDAENVVQLTIGEVRLPNGTHLSNVRIDTPEDERQFHAPMAVATASSPTQTARATPSLEREVHHRDDFFAHQMEVHLVDLERGGRDKKTLMESRHTLALFRGMPRLPPKPAWRGVPKSPTRPEYEGVRAALVALRVEAGLTQVELAERLKRSQGQVSEVERGIKRVDPPQVWDWCHACGSDLEAWGALIEARIQVVGQTGNKREQDPPDKG